MPWIFRVVLALPFACLATPLLAQTGRALAVLEPPQVGATARFEVAYPAAAVGNFGWFLELCKEHGWIGWIDFMSNVVVNVPAEYTVSYMGELYAKCTVVPQGLYEQAALVDAMSRAWIFQEMTFGALDEEAMGGLFEQLRERGRAAYDALAPRDALADGAAIRAYLRSCGLVAMLLTRRAFGAMAAGCGRRTVRRLH